MDTRPRFPLPSDLIQEFTSLNRSCVLETVIMAWNTSFANLTDIPHALSSIASMAQFINESAQQSLLWEDEWFVCLRFLPVLHQLLSLRRNEADQLARNPDLVIREILRGTLIVLLAMMNRRFRDFSDRVELYRTRG
jgi:hypothetical protein